jgi:uncharacterized protein (DUF58 family)
VVTGRLATVAAAASLAVLALPLSAPVGLLVVNVALFVVAAVDWWLAPRPGALAVERELPSVATLGAAVPLTWRVVNPTPRPVRVRLADELAPSLGAARRRARLAVPAGGRAAVATVLRPARRGRFTPTEVVLRVDGPMGLVARQGRRSVPGVLRVYPPFRARQEVELRLDRARLLDVGLRSAAGRGGGTEFDSLRDYTVDDELRRVDWAATARAGRPIVRTYRAERDQVVLVLLDVGRVMAGRVGGVPRLDHAMDAVLAVTAVASRLGDRVGLTAFGAAVRTVVPPGHGRSQLRRVTEALYALTPELAESDYRGAFAHVLTHARRRALVVLLTDLSEAPVAEGLLPALPLVARDHVAVVAAVTDPDVATWAAAVPADAEATYRKAAAADALATRRRTAALLQGKGARVVDARPADLPARLADAYLEAKATGRV